MNAIIWIRQGKTQLALANISGAMMIQATVPSGLGLLFTSWTFDARAALVRAGDDCRDRLPPDAPCGSGG